VSATTCIDYFVSKKLVSDDYLDFSYCNMHDLFCYWHMYSNWQGWIELCMVNLVPQFDPKLTYAPNSPISGSSSPVLSGLYAKILDHAFWFWVHLIDTNSWKCSVKFCECQECSTSFFINFSTVYLYSKIKCRWSNESIWVKVVIYSITRLFAAWKFTVNYISFFIYPFSRFIQ